MFAGPTTSCVVPTFIDFNMFNRRNKGIYKIPSINTFTIKIIIHLKIPYFLALFYFKVLYLYIKYAGVFE